MLSHESSVGPWKVVLVLSSVGSTALDLLNDPTDLAEKVFAQLRSQHMRFEVKLILMNLLSRFHSANSGPSPSSPSSSLLALAFLPSP